MSDSDSDSSLAVAEEVFAFASDLIFDSMMRDAVANLHDGAIQMIARDYLLDHAVCEATADELPQEMSKSGN